MVGRLCVNARPGRVRARIEAVLDGCIAKVERDATRGNPPDAKLIAALFPMGRKRGDRPHFRRIELDATPATLRLKATAEIKSSGAPDAWLFMIRTCAQPSEALEACWDEIDLDPKLWTLPPSRAKHTKAHTVPLSSIALEILATRARAAPATWCSPAGRDRR